MDGLQSAAGRAQQALWWPFTQHKTLGPKDVTLIDARCGESFAVVRPSTGSCSWICFKCVLLIIKARDHWCKVCSLSLQVECAAKG